MDPQLLHYLPSKARKRPINPRLLMPLHTLTLYPREAVQSGGEFFFVIFLRAMQHLAPLVRHTNEGDRENRQQDTMISVGGIPKVEAACACVC